MKRSLAEPGLDIVPNWSAYLGRGRLSSLQSVDVRRQSRWLTTPEICACSRSTPTAASIVEKLGQEVNRIAAQRRQLHGRC